MVEYVVGALLTAIASVLSYSLGVRKYDRKRFDELYKKLQEREEKLKETFAKAMYLSEHGHKIGSYKRFKEEMESLDRKNGIT